MAEKPGYEIDVQIAGAEEAKGRELPPDWGTVLPTADVEAGKAVFAKCQSCHKPTRRKRHRSWPGRRFGRQPGTHPTSTILTA